DERARERHRAVTRSATRCGRARAEPRCVDRGDGSFPVRVAVRRPADATERGARRGRHHESWHPGAVDTGVRRHVRILREPVARVVRCRFVYGFCVCGHRASCVFRSDDDLGCVGHRVVRIRAVADGTRCRSRRRRAGPRPGCAARRSAIRRPDAEHRRSVGAVADADARRGAARAGAPVGYTFRCRRDPCVADSAARAVFDRDARLSCRRSRDHRPGVLRSRVAAARANCERVGVWIGGAGAPTLPRHSEYGAPRFLGDAGDANGDDRFGVTVVDAEVLVVGSRAGGVVTAHALAPAGVDVLLVEEGPRGPAGEYARWSPDAMERFYRRRGMTPIVGRVPIGFVEGRCLGGSTEINSGFWHRTPPEVILRWQSQYALADTTPESLEPHFAWAEDLLGVALHTGPLPRSSSILADGAERMHWSVQQVPRMSRRCRDLLPAVEAAGARVVTDARVRLLLREGSRVTGVLAEIQRPDRTRALVRINADDVFVCGGATETPALLRRSGIRYRVG